MGHNITGLLAPRDALRGAPGLLASQPRYALEHDFALMPLDSENLDTILGGELGTVPGEWFFLSERLIEALRQASSARKFAYIETEHFGGAGVQGAVAFSNGEITSAPDWRESDPIMTRWRLSAWRNRAPISTSSPRLY